MKSTVNDLDSNYTREHIYRLIKIIRELNKEFLIYFYTIYITYIINSM